MIRLEAPQLDRLRRELAARARGARPEQLISVALELPTGRDDWLAREPAAASWRYWAVPAAGDWRLGLGRAVSLPAAGEGRFAALNLAYAHLVGGWRRGDVAPTAFLGFSFDTQRPGGLPCAEITVPAVLLASRSGLRRAVFSCLARDAEAAPRRWLAALSARPATGANRQWWRRATPFSDRMWLARVEAALGDIAAGRLKKVVLSRSAQLVSREAFEPMALLSALARQHDGGTLFAAGGGSNSFLGLTPERLVSLAAGRVHADALAGTAWQGDGEALLGDDKNRREQALVVEAIQEALSPLCRALTVPPAPRLLGARRIRHLHSAIEGEVRDGAGLLDLVAALHPTPAVGGMPTAAAQGWLRAHGEEREDWYTGGFGWLDPDGEGEVRVALRCATLSGRKARLYAGAGIVAGSVPARELAETEAKLGTLLEAFESYRKEAAEAEGAFPLQMAVGT